MEAKELLTTRDIAEGVRSENLRRSNTPISEWNRRGRTALRHINYCPSPRRPISEPHAIKKSHLYRSLQVTLR